MTTPVSKLRIHLALLSVSAIYGFFYIAVKLLLKEISQSELVLMRFVLTALIVGLIEWIWFKTRFNNATEALKVAFLGLLGVFAVQTLIVYGVKMTTAFHSALIMSTIPIWTLLFSLLSGREQFHPRKISGILLAFAGVAFLITESTWLHAAARVGVSTSQNLPPTCMLGDALILCAAFAFSWFLLGTQTLLKQYNSYSLMSYCYIVSAIAFLLVFLAQEVTGEAPQGFAYVTTLSWQGWGLMLYIVFFASIVSYTLNNYALRRVSPSVVSVYTFLQPVLSAVFGFTVLNEPFNPAMVLAAIVTFSGVLLASSTPHTRPPDPGSKSFVPDQEPL